MHFSLCSIVVVVVGAVILGSLTTVSRSRCLVVFIASCPGLMLSSAVYRSCSSPAMCSQQTNYVPVSFGTTGMFDQFPLCHHQSGLS